MVLDSYWLKTLSMLPGLRRHYSRQLVVGCWQVSYSRFSRLVALGCSPCSFFIAVDILLARRSIGAGSQLRLASFPLFSSVSSPISCATLCCSIFHLRHMKKYSQSNPGLRSKGTGSSL